MDETLRIQVKHLREVEGLSLRQIAAKLGVSRKKVWRLTREEKMRKPVGSLILRPYERLIEKWYREYPTLKATQVYERLKSYKLTFVADKPPPPRIASQELLMAAGTSAEYFS